MREKHPHTCEKSERENRTHTDARNSGNGKDKINFSPFLPFTSPAGFFPLAFFLQG